MDTVFISENHLRWQGSFCYACHTSDGNVVFHRRHYYVNLEEYAEMVDLLKCILSHNLGALCSLPFLDFEARFCFYDETDARYETTLLLFTIRFGSFEQLEWLLEHGANSEDVENIAVVSYSVAGIEYQFFSSKSAIELAKKCDHRNDQAAIIKLLEEWTYGGATIKSAK